MVLLLTIVSPRIISRHRPQIQLVTQRIESINLYALARCWSENFMARKLEVFIIFLDAIQRMVLRRQTRKGMKEEHYFVIEKKLKMLSFPSY